MIAINIDLDPIPGKFIASTQPFNYTVRLYIICASCEVQVLIIMEDLKLCLLVGRCTFIRLILNKITGPFDLFPFCFIYDAIHPDETTFYSLCDALLSGPAIRGQRSTTNLSLKNSGHKDCNYYPAAEYK